MTILTPTSGPEDWKILLADPEKHWAKGKSARTLAHCWEDTKGFPREVKQILGQAEALAGINPLLILPEWKVRLAGQGADSQNDIWVLAKAGSELVSISVEGKVDESFGPTLGKWFKDASKNKEVRLKSLSATLGLAYPPPSDIYYQLLHRAASAVIEAERFNCAQAVMLVHSFSQTNLWFDKYCEFVSLWGTEAKIGPLVTVSAKGGMPLHLGWVKGNKKYLEC